MKFFQGVTFQAQGPKPLLQRKLVMKGGNYPASEYAIWNNSKNGTGDNVTVNFGPTSNPSIKTLDPKTGNVAGAKRPNQVRLELELIHANHITEVKVSFSPTNQTVGGNVTQTKTNEELRTVGLKGVKKGDVTENQIRKEQGQNPRGKY